jgi:hypothetical protein
VIKGRMGLVGKSECGMDGERESEYVCVCGGGGRGDRPCDWRMGVKVYYSGAEVCG